MNWYYVDAGQQAGPVDDAQLESLAQSGKIQPDTLIWSQGMANWQPYSEVKGGGGPTATAIAAPPVTGNEAVCAECGRVFNKQDMITYGTVNVCAACKPIFMQKLAEGAALRTGVLNYAGFWTRFAAVFLDGILLYIVNFVTGLVLGLGAAQAIGTEPTAALGIQLLVTIIGLIIGITYETVMIGKFGATLGKMACKIKVVTPEGGRVSYGRALGRYFAKILSGMICLIGYIMAGFDEEKRALHDRICNTRVVTKQA